MGKRARLACLGVLFGVSLGAGLGACSAGNKATSEGVGGGDTAGPATGSTGPSMSIGSGMGGGFPFDGGNVGAGGLDMDAACSATSSEAKPGIQPADIIIAVDTSGSMQQEKDQVQMNLNNFASIILQSGIDVHVILIADDSVSIPAPLGSGNMPDDNPPHYQHVHFGVDSNNALDIFLSQYPNYKASLRASASKTFLVVSDDESDMTVAAFTQQIVALDPTFQGFKFDSIVSSQDPVTCEAACLAGGCVNCGPCCLLCVPISAAEGKVYEDLVAQTMGVSGDLCLENFAPVFMDMATAVVTGAKIACDYPIPQPDGGTLDPAKVNVSYTPGGQMMGQPILNVPGGSKDCGPNGGWYYDDPVNPTTITMCPATCTALQSDPNGKVEILFGCKTEMQPPQ